MVVPTFMVGLPASLNLLETVADTPGVPLSSKASLLASTAVSLNLQVTTPLGVTYQMFISRSSIKNDFMVGDLY